jgi:hypothetical protein
MLKNRRLPDNSAHSSTWYLRLFRRAIVCLVVAAACLMFKLPTSAAQSSYSSVTLPGASAYALLLAYRSMPNEKSDLEAPFTLESTSIEVLQRADEILVGFFPNRTKAATVVTIRDSRVVAQDSSPINLNVEPILLPGVTAGAIIAAYNTALERNDLVTRDSAKTPFNVQVVIGAGGALVSFVPLQIATLPNYKCVAGNCDARSNYLVRIETGKTIVTHRW